ncbi:hypothetical protein E2R51_07975 [Jeotgalibacillus sp. S-D1]|uniref:hypothetical protein n=1 Tax=Jeotgalibacillus sp. S-D1 TaxID=2552189 RepID=UPI00105A2A2C|nr:hypothetical protein [Jeotgalibacillus sp. S-D1]TDL32613.1 hypothetical protein E2R51_07975 [Jeotgalibacillus sp. S-D1]
MNLFSFGRNKKNGETATEDRKVQTNEEKKQLKRKVEMMVDGLTKSYSTDSIHQSISQQVDKKRYINPTLEQYKQSLLQNLIYFLEVEKEIKRTLSTLLHGEKFESVQALDQHLLKIQSRVRNDMEELITANHDKYYHKYLAKDEGVNGLEREFIDHTVLHSWYIDACFYFQNNAQWDISEEVPKRWVVSEIERTFMWKLSQHLYLYNFDQEKDY